ncbi:MAG: O-antigen ligase family protein [Gammaproteobacteria bacterium]
MLRTKYHSYSSPVEIEGLADRMGIAGLYIFSFGAWLHKSVAITGLTLMLLATLLNWKAIWGTVKHSSLTWVTISVGIYLLARTFLSFSSDSDHAHLHLKDGLRFFYLCGFLLIAWHMAASQKRILTVFVIAFSGFLIARLWYVDWSFASATSWWKLRQGLGLPEIAFGFYAATAMLGLLIFAPRIFNKTWPVLTRLTLALVWTVLTPLMVQGIVISQSRAVWASVLVITSILMMVSWTNLKTINQTGRWTLLIVLITSTVLLLHLNRDILFTRVTLEQETYSHVLSGDFNKITSINEQGQGNSVGIRLLMLKTGLQHWIENPLFGKGPAASKILLQKSEVEFFSQLNDWHNGPIDILVRYGLAGLILLTLCLWMTLRAGWSAYQDNRIDPDIFLFLVCGMALIILSMLTNFRMLNSDWRYWLFLFSGAMASFNLHRKNTG